MTAAGVTYRSCTSKRRYRSEYEAAKAIKRRQSLGWSQPLRVYWCNKCDGFHLTRKQQAYR